MRSRKESDIIKVPLNEAGSKVKNRGYCSSQITAFTDTMKNVYVNKT